jgi:hyperosmotically inducible periplasmic protein
MNTVKLRVLPVIAAIFAAGPAAVALAEADERPVQQQVQDAWVKGKLESAYLFNRHLSPFDIRTEVRDGVVTLSGAVATDIERDLAEEIAKGVEGIDQVNNELELNGDGQQASAADDDERRTFGRWVNDVTTSAAVRANLIRNDNITARDISIETRDDVVTLTGLVDTAQERELAERLASNTGDVKQVRNELQVRN